jgi:hypothetical protein
LVAKRAQDNGGDSVRFYRARFAGLARLLIQIKLVSDLGG